MAEKKTTKKTSTTKKTTKKEKEFVPFTGTVKTEKNFLNVRSDPKIAVGNIVGRLSKGSSVKVLGEYGDWYKITYSGVMRYVLKEFVER